MKKLLFITLIFSVLSAQAQDAKALFDSIPEAVVPLLSPVNRADFIDFLQSDMKAEVKNRFGSTSEMTDLTSDYIRIQMTSVSTWEMKLLPVNDSIQVVCTISTACGPVCDSELRFYSADWKELSLSDYITLPVADDFFHLSDSTKLYEYENYRKKIDMFLVKAELAKESPTLTLALTTPEYLSSEAEGVTRGFIKSPLVYVWKQHPSTGRYGFYND